MDREGVEVGREQETPDQRNQQSAIADEAARDRPGYERLEVSHGDRW